jgi:hypothetical protein
VEKFIANEKAKLENKGNADATTWAKIRSAMAGAIGNGKDLTYQQNLALHLKFLELQLGITTIGDLVMENGNVTHVIRRNEHRVEIGRDSIKDAFEWSKQENNQFAGFGALNSEIRAGKSTLDQA